MFDGNGDRGVYDDTLALIFGAKGDALRDADRRKDEFLATLAHELLNPLTPIRISLSLLRRAGGASPTETPPRSGSPRSSPTCSTTPPDTRSRAAESGSRSAESRSLGSARRPCLRRSSETISRRRAGSGSAWRAKGLAEMHGGSIDARELTFSRGTRRDRTVPPERPTPRIPRTPRHPCSRFGRRDLPIQRLPATSFDAGTIGSVRPKRTRSVLALRTVSAATPRRPGSPAADRNWVRSSTEIALSTLAKLMLRNTLRRRPVVGFVRAENTRV